MGPTIHIPCPYCRAHDAVPWASERGYTCVKCRECGFLYVNPRPADGQIAEGVETGVHSTLGGHNVIGRRSEAKVAQYRGIFRQVMADVWSRGHPISWLDVGAGHGEIVEAVTALAPIGSAVMGVEPMLPKAASARRRGIDVVNGYLDEVDRKFDFLSLIHVFSHVPDFRSFLGEVKGKLVPGGEFLIETGNIADLDRATQNSTDLDLPDHLTFAGHSHIVGFLEEAGFEIVSVRSAIRDDFVGLAKALAKKALGRPANVVVPFTSPYRNLMFRSRLRS